MGCGDVKALLLAPEGPESPELAGHLAACHACAKLAAGLAGLDRALRSSVIVVEPPAELQAHLAALVPDAALRASVVVEPPAELQARLAALVPLSLPLGEGEGEAYRAQPLPITWRQRLGGLFGGLTPGAVAFQLAVLSVLAYAGIQLFGWVTSLPVVLGDVPYALELLVWSPAVDYLAGLQPLLQQFGLWLLVAAAAWLFAQGTPWRHPTVS